MKRGLDQRQHWQEMWLWLDGTQSTASILDWNRVTCGAISDSRACHRFVEWFWTCQIDLRWTLKSVYLRLGFVCKPCLDNWFPFVDLGEMWLEFSQNTFFSYFWQELMQHWITSDKIVERKMFCQWFLSNGGALLQKKTKKQKKHLRITKSLFSSGRKGTTGDDMAKINAAGFNVLIPVLVEFRRKEVLSAYWKALVPSAATAVCQNVLVQDARPKFLLVACVRIRKTEHTVLLLSVWMYVNVQSIYHLNRWLF